MRKMKCIEGEKDEAVVSDGKDEEEFTVTFSNLAEKPCMWASRLSHRKHAIIDETSVQGTIYWLKQFWGQIRERAYFVTAPGNWLAKNRQQLLPRKRRGILAPLHHLLHLAEPQGPWLKKVAKAMAGNNKRLATNLFKWIKCLLGMRSNFVPELVSYLKCAKFCGTDASVMYFLVGDNFKWS